VRAVLSALCSALLVFGSATALADADDHVPAKDEYSEEFQGYVEGASYLEGRIRAPCCWNQTIDIHGSEPANQLRREIRRRLKAGETTDQIEASLVTRYGEKILAVPPGNPLVGVATALAVGVMFAGAGAAFALVRWRRRSGPGFKPETPSPGKEAKRDEWDDRLDQELEKVDR
jgi:cytochrome c-type biogenesis protein CcmH